MSNDKSSQGAEMPKNPGLDNFEIPNPKTESSSVIFSQMPDLSYNKPVSESNCFTDMNGVYINFAKVKINKYEQLKLLKDYVDACKSSRTSDNWWEYYIGLYIDENCPWFIPPLKKLTKEELREINEKNEDNTCEAYIWNESAQNSGSKAWWFRYDWYRNQFESGTYWRQWMVDYHLFLKDGTGGWSDKWWVKRYYPNGWIKRRKEYQRRWNGLFRQWNTGKLIPTIGFILENCPILAAVTDPNGRKQFEVDVDGLTYDYGLLWDEFRKPNSFISCNTIKNNLNKDEHIGEYWRASYYFTPKIKDGLINGSDFNGKALNRYGFIDMTKVPDKKARTGNGGTGIGNNLCGIVDNLILKSSRNCKNGLLLPEKEEAPSEESGENMEFTHQCNKENNNTCIDKIYNSKYEWCFSSEVSNELTYAYGAMIDACRANCILNDFKNENNDIDENYIYDVVKNDGETWKGFKLEPDASLKNDEQKIIAQKINEFSMDNYKCDFDKRHLNLDNYKTLVELPECCAIADNGGKAVCNRDKDGKTVSCYYTGENGEKINTSDGDNFTNKKKSREDIELFINRRRKNFTASAVIEHFWLNLDLIKEDGSILEILPSNINGQENKDQLKDLIENVDENIYNSENNNICKIIHNSMVNNLTTWNNYEKIKSNFKFTELMNNKRAYKKKLIQFKLYSIELINKNSNEDFNDLITNIKKYIFIYIYFLKFENSLGSNTINEYEKYIRKILNNTDDFKAHEYKNILDYLQMKKKDYNTDTYIAKIRNISIINTTKYYRIFLWIIALAGLSYIIYKKIKNKD